MALPALNGAHAPDLDDGSEPLSARLYIALTPSMLRTVEDYFHERRHKNLSDAARQLLVLGLQSSNWRKRPNS
jgi:hypothetical protein